MRFRRTRLRQYSRRCCRIADERCSSVDPLQRMTGSHRRSDNHAAEIPRDLNCHVWLLLFQGIASHFFSALFSRGAKVQPRRYRRIASCVRNAWSQGNLNHLRRAPTASGTAEPPLPRPVCGERKRGKQCNPDRTATYETFGSMEPNQAQGTVAEVRRLVGRDWRMGASLIASLPIASAPLARDSCRVSFQIIAVLGRPLKIRL